MDKSLGQKPGPAARVFCLNSALCALAFEKFLANAQAAAGSIEERGETVRAGAKDINAKAFSYAERNVQASLDYAQSLLHAKDLTEVTRLHGEYVKAQMGALTEQANEMGKVAARAAMDAAKPKV